MDVRQYLEQVDAIVAATRSAKISPAGMLDGWAYFVEECEGGYTWDVGEFDNELGVRTLIARVLTDPDVGASNFAIEFRRNVEPWDDRFRQLLHPDWQIPGRDHWWETGVLKCAGRDYAEYMRSAHGFDVQIVES